MIRGTTVALRAPEESDVEVLHKWFQEESFRLAVGYRYPSSKRMWTQWIASYEQVSYNNATFIFCMMDSGAPIGLGSLSHQSPEDRSAEFGIAIGETDNRRRGLGAEAGELLARFGFEVMGLRRMYSWILTQNSAAVAACESIGAIREGVARNARLVHGAPADLALYGLLAEEFAAIFRKTPSTPAGAGQACGE
ncbi:GNAT family N-acetyltransferase [Nocardia vinacea]|uniref:GNAT family N-acetyltransferase n=1 Tax=Nocardia vinacea TaxID=96468 RepID=A0ABZ1YL32_9NOCA|nr:GNAT family N-acetyltransferase [Nocardia vinacea]